MIKKDKEKSVAIIITADLISLVHQILLLLDFSLRLAPSARFCRTLVHGFPPIPDSRKGLARKGIPDGLLAACTGLP